MITCRNTASQEANFIHRSCWIDFSNWYIMHNCIFAEGWGSHKMIYWFSIQWKSRWHVRNHHTSPCSWSYFATKVRFPWRTCSTLPALCLVTRNNMITWFQTNNTFPNALNDTAKERHKLQFASLENLQHIPSCYYCFSILCLLSNFQTIKFHERKSEKKSRVIFQSIHFQSSFWDFATSSTCIPLKYFNVSSINMKWSQGRVSCDTHSYAYF